MAEQGDQETSGASPGDELDRQSPRDQLSADQIEEIRQTFVGKDPDASRFTLWGLLGVVSAASLILALGTYFPKPIFAGAVGIATLISLVALSAMKQPPGIWQVAWWTLLLIYLMAIFSAVLG